LTFEFWTFIFVHFQKATPTFKNVGSTNRYYFIT